MENYNASKRNSYIMYLDANNLYGSAMSQPLPTSNFKWLTDEEMEELDVMMGPDDSSRGYILECDLGEAMENLRNQRTVDLVTSEDSTQGAAQPCFKQFKIFHENLVAVERARVELTLNRPIYAGFVILGLSKKKKMLMYDFCYNYIKLITDTDSLTYQI